MTFIHVPVYYLSVQCSAISPHPRAAKVPMVQLAHRWPGAGHAAEGGSLEHRGSFLFVEEAVHKMPAIAGRCASLHKDGQNRSSSRHPGFSEANVPGTVST